MSGVFDLPQAAVSALDVLELEKLTAFQFVVQIDGEFTGKEFVAGFHEVAGIGDQVDIQVVREGGYPGVHRFPRRARQDALTLRRGMTFSRSLSDWFDEVRVWTKGRDDYKRTMSIYLIDRIGTPAGQVSFEAWRWDVYGAWPSTWEGPKLHAQEQKIAIESVTVEHSGIIEGKGLLSGSAGEILSIFQ